MVAHLPEDILLEIIKLLSSDIQTLRSCAVTSYALARGCRPYIFRTVNLSGRPRPRSIYRDLGTRLVGSVFQMRLSVGPDESRDIQIGKWAGIV